MSREHDWVVIPDGAEFKVGGVAVGAPVVRGRMPLWFCKSCRLVSLESRPWAGLAPGFRNCDEAEVSFVMRC